MIKQIIKNHVLKIKTTLKNHTPTRLYSCEEMREIIGGDFIVEPIWIGGQHYNTFLVTTRATGQFVCRIFTMQYEFEGDEYYWCVGDDE